MTALTSPELDLVIACCRWPRGGGGAAAIRSAAGRVTDWDEFERLVERHRVTPLVQRAVVAGDLQPPRAARERLAARAARRAVVALKMAQESVRLQRAFDSAGLPCLILKGTAVGVLAYGDPCLKESFDIDLLTTEKHLGRARAALEELGYALFSPSGLSDAEFEQFTLEAVEASFLNRVKRLAVDLHWGLDRNRYVLPMISAESPSQVVCFGGAELRTLTDDLLYAYLCAHGTKHGWSRLKWLADLGAFFGNFEEADVRRLHEAAVKLGAGNASGVALRLCNRLFDTPVPDEIMRTLERNWRVRRLEAVSMHYLRAPIAVDQTGAPPAIWLFLAQLIQMPGAAYLLEQLRGIWVLPEERARLASWSHLLRLPMWLARRFKRTRLAGSESE
jgi:hypothetical protein